uniref:C1q domain-containing protein n=1 Tax=Ciona savignyi TaxID=51511 RepID=H2YAS7_CIOSA
MEATPRARDSNNISNQHRTFRPCYNRRNSEIRPENKTTSSHSRDQLVTCLLILSLSLAALSASFTIHLAIENYKRVAENKELLMKIYLLNKKVLSNEELLKPNVGIKPENKTAWLPTLSLKQKPLEVNRQNELANKTRTKISGVVQKTTDLYPHRYYVSKFREIEDSIREFQKGQRFLRQQIHQRLGVLERQSMTIVRNTEFYVAFHVFLGSDFSPNPIGEVIHFDHVILNDGGGFNSGYFRSPVTGIYLITANIILKERE